MDHGHYNCRDYYVSPHFARASSATTATTTTTLATPILSSTSDRSPFYRSPFARHESFDELEQRSKSPASSKPKFPLLRLPLELRQQILQYLLPRTIEQPDPVSLANHARNGSVIKKRGVRSMMVPQAQDHSRKGTSNVVWQRGNISLLSVCRQMHDECAELLYGTNTFLLFVTYTSITFRYSWLLPSGLAPNRRFNFLDLFSHKYMALIKILAINVDHVDSYTSMIKFNVSSSGLTHGLRKQAQRLVNAMQQSPQIRTVRSATPEEDTGPAMVDARRLGRVTIRVSSGNALLDQLKSEVVRQREGATKVAQDVQEMLEPFGNLRGVRDVCITGAVTDNFARNLEQQMKSLETPETGAASTHGLRDLDIATSHRLCCYGNDL